MCIKSLPVCCVHLDSTFNLDLMLTLYPSHLQLITTMTIKRATAVLLFLAAAVHIASAYCSALKNLDQNYPYMTNLDEGFKLYWKYDLEQQSITFAVNVSTNGWFGFGISPEGKMLDSDIVVGWVNSDGSAQFHVSHRPLKDDSNYVCLL